MKSLKDKNHQHLGHAQKPQLRRAGKHRQDEESLPV